VSIVFFLKKEVCFMVISTDSPVRVTSYVSFFDVNSGCYRYEKKIEYISCSNIKVEPKVPKGFPRKRWHFKVFERDLDRFSNNKTPSPGVSTGNLLEKNKPIPEGEIPKI
jgi:hypothetical protein